MITVEQYFGRWLHHQDATIQRVANATILLARVNALLAELVAQGVQLHTNTCTASCVSGETMGGFRPQSCPIGAPNSAHKEGMAVDVFDQLNELDSWITKNPELLIKYDLYREHPVATNTWLHLSTREPASGRRTFFP